MPSLVADMAETLVVIEESRGEPSSIIADGTAIRRMISERHGVQRARLGWTWMRSVSEHALLRAEVEGAIHRRFLGEREGRIAEAIRVIDQLVLMQKPAPPGRCNEKADQSNNVANSAGGWVVVLVAG